MKTEPLYNHLSLLQIASLTDPDEVDWIPDMWFLHLILKPMVGLLCFHPTYNQHQRLEVKPKTNWTKRWTRTKPNSLRSPNHEQQPQIKKKKKRTKYKGWKLVCEFRLLVSSLLIEFLSSSCSWYNLSDAAEWDFLQQLLPPTGWRCYCTSVWQHRLQRLLFNDYLTCQSAQYQCARSQHHLDFFTWVKDQDVADTVSLDLN